MYMIINSFRFRFICINIFSINKKINNRKNKMETQKPIFVRHFALNLNYALLVIMIKFIIF